MLLPACELWIRQGTDRQPPQGRGPWMPGRHQLQLIDLRLDVPRQGEGNPTHTHGGSFSGLIVLQLSPQISVERFDGQLCCLGPEEWPIQSCRTGMAPDVRPVPGDDSVLPAWQPHSVCPFRGEGECWSIPVNVVALPQAGRPLAPTAGQARSVTAPSMSPC